MGFFLTLLILILSCVSSASPTCKNPVVRKEWRTLNKLEQLCYIEAVKCLQSKPSKTTAYFEGTRNRFDDFQATHISQTDFIHFVGIFHPWHRWFLATYETALRNECGYLGAQPYWDWTLDATIETFPESPLFDPVFGFGGNGPFIDSANYSTVKLHVPGKTGGGCVKDGPFKDMKVNLGPFNSTAYNPRCLTRDFSPLIASEKLNTSVVEKALTAATFEGFDVAAQGGVSIPALSYHGGGHLGAGGELGTVGDVYASPGDPLFYLHHANLDRLWWKWESYDLNVRVKDISGPITQYGYPFNFFGPVPSANITLDYVMDVGHVNPAVSSVILKDIMNIQGGVLCYSYAD